MPPEDGLVSGAPGGGMISSWPTWSRFGSVSWGLAVSSWPTVRSNLRAMRLRVSPLRTTYVRAVGRGVGVGSPLGVARDTGVGTGRVVTHPAASVAITARSITTTERWADRAGIRRPPVLGRRVEGIPDGESGL